MYVVIEEVDWTGSERHLAVFAVVETKEEAEEIVERHKKEINRKWKRSYGWPYITVHIIEVEPGIPTEFVSTYHTGKGVF